MAASSSGQPRKHPSKTVNPLYYDTSRIPGHCIHSVEILSRGAGDMICVLSYRCRRSKIGQLARCGLEVWTAEMEHEPEERVESRFVRTVPFLSPCESKQSSRCGSLIFRITDNTRDFMQFGGKKKRLDLQVLVGTKVSEVGFQDELCIGFVRLKYPYLERWEGKELRRATARD